MRIQAIHKMPLSIDEAESRCTSGSRKVTRVDGGEGKTFRGKFRLFMENLQNRTGNQNGKNLPKQNQANNVKIQEEKLMAGETFAGGGSSIQVQPGKAAQATQRNYKKKPRGGSRGAMTRSLSGR
jgi:hypothetical protein